MDQIRPTSPNNYYEKLRQDLSKTLENLKQQGLYKAERVITSPQNAKISVSQNQLNKSQQQVEVLNFCSNNYLGLANHPAVIQGAKDALDKYGYGLSSVRFICGTQQLHKDLENKVSEFLGTEDTILYSSCFDANCGVFETILSSEQDAIISDELNHASIIDGIRLCKAQRLKYRHSDMGELKKCLEQLTSRQTPAHSSPRYILIVTDGVFSMDGEVARLDQICALAEQYGALVMVDDSHATGYIGNCGRGSASHCGMAIDRVHIISTTFGKALGGSQGGCISGKREIVQFLRQRSRPYLFSNTLAPAVCGGSLRALEIVQSEEGRKLQEKTMRNAKLFREKMQLAGFDLVSGNTAIVPVMLYDEVLAVRFADELLQKGIYVIGFCFPVVPKGRARIRVQLSAAHSCEMVEKAVEAFVEVGKKLKLTTLKKARL